MTTWLPPIHDQGRTDLDAPTLTARRDAFARAALHQLNAPPHPRDPDRTSEDHEHMIKEKQRLRWANAGEA